MVALLLVLWGCAAPLHVEVSPLGARAQITRAAAVETPASLRVPWAPLRAQALTVSAPGYRPYRIPLDGPVWPSAAPLRYRIFHPVAWATGRPLRALEVQLVPEHGPMGSE